jgi:signal transduction histidine kinase
MLQQVTGEIRTVSHLLHPPLLDEVGLESALRWYVEGFAERSKVSVNLELPEDLERLPQECELTLFRVVQECLTNIHRHSGSSTATVRISRNDTEAKLEVKDDGRGMSQKRQMEIYSGESSGVGLRGMRERVRQIGGTLGIQSSAIGTSITVVLPLAAKTRTANESR